MKNTLLIIFTITSILSYSQTPISHWSFEECAGTTISDGIGTNNGLLVGGVWDAGHQLQGLVFDGVDDGVSIPTSSNLNLSNQISVSFWVNGAAQASKTLVGKHNGGSVNERSWLVISGNSTSTDKIRVMISADGGAVNRKVYQTSVSVLDNSWHHFAFTYENNDLKIYVDGVEDVNVVKSSDPTIGAMNTNVIDVTIGYASVSGQPDFFFDGVMDEVEMYNQVLSGTYIAGKASIAQSSTVCSSLSVLSHWSFDDCSGSIVTDGEGLNNGTLVGGAWEPGYEKQAITFDGVDDGVSIPSSNSLDITDELSVGLWLKGNAQISKTIAGKHDGGSNNNRTWLIISGSSGNDDKLRVMISSDGGGVNRKVYQTSLSVLDGSWHYFAFTYQNNDLKLYVDGIEDVNVLKQSDPTIGSIHSNTVDVTVGYAYSNGQPSFFFSGTVDEMELHNRILTVSEISTKASLSQNPMTCSVANTLPIGEWRMDNCYANELHDYYGNNNGTVINADYQIGYFHNGLYFDGATAGANIPHSNTLDLSSEISVSLWVKGNAQASKTLIGKHNGTILNNRSWLVVSGSGTYTDKMRVMISADGGGVNRKVYQTSLSVLDGNWHHFAFTFKSNTLKLYVDGVEDVNVLKSNDPVVNTMYSNTTDITMGYALNNGANAFIFNGFLDHVSIYNQELTDQQIGALIAPSNAIDPCYVAEGVPDAKLTKKIQGNYYQLNNNQLYFQYEEEYIDRDLTYKIWNQFHIEQLQITQIIPVDFGLNHLSVDCTSLSSGTYLLEVTGAKGEKQFLQFKK